MVNPDTPASRAAGAIALTAVAVSVAVLAGWCLGVEMLKRVAPGLVAMNPTSAIAFILSGTSLALLLRPPPVSVRTLRLLKMAARLGALAVTLIGLAKLFPTQLEDGHSLPNRIAPNTALNFLLLGGAVLGVDAKNRFARFWLELAAIIIAFGSLVAILGYAYHIDAFYGLSSFIPMALHTAITFLLLSSALLLAQTDQGLLAVFAGDSAGGAMARHLLPAAILVPAVLGWVTLQGENAGIYHGEFGSALFVVGSILAFTILVALSSRDLYKVDRRRQVAEANLQRQQTELRVLFDLIPAMIWFKDTQNQILRVNQRVAAITGKAIEEIEGKPALENYPVEAAKYFADDLEVIQSGMPKLGIIETIRGPAGEEIWVQTDKVPYRDQQGEVIGIVVMAQDITERKRLEAQLLQSNKMETVGKLAESAPPSIGWSVQVASLIVAFNACVLPRLPPSQI